MSDVRSAVITGAAGFIGSALVKQLLCDGVRVTCVVRDQVRAERLRRAGKVRVVEADLGRGDTPDELFGDEAPDVIYNLASYGVHQGQRDVRLLIDGNIGVVASVVSLSARCVPAPTVIHVGSCSEYGNATAGEYVTEDHALVPTSVYGAAKASSSMFGASLARALEVPFVSLRLFGVFGEGESDERLIPYLLHTLQRGEQAKLTGGEQVRDLLYVGDVVDALTAAARNRHRLVGEAYNVCSSRPTRIRDVGETAARVLGCPQSLLRWGALPYRADEPMWLVGDNRRFCEATSWQPRISLEEGIRRMVASAATAIRE
jgi:nucleoside-diphosphate-sugar epimerase